MDYSIKPINVPAALNDPHYVRLNDIFSKRYGDSFENPSLQKSHDKLVRSDFDGYLKTLNKLIKFSHSSNQSQKHRPDPLTTDVDLPPYFYSKKFSFQNPLVYKALLPGPYEKLNNWLGPANQIHEQLSQQLDGIESKIAFNVSKKSGNFIHALSYVSNLRDNLTLIRDAIHTTRFMIDHYHKTYATTLTKLIRLHTKRQNYQKIIGKLKIMVVMCQSQPSLQVLLANAEYMGAFDLVASSRSILNLQIKGVRSFRHLDAQLVEIENVIFRMLWAEYTAILHRNLINSHTYNDLNSNTKLQFDKEYNNTYCNHIKNTAKKLPFSPKECLNAQDNPTMHNLLNQIESLKIRNGYKEINSDKHSLPTRDFESIANAASNYDLLSQYIQFSSDNLLASNINNSDFQSLVIELSPVILGLLYLKNLSFIEFLKEESCTLIDDIIAKQLKMVIHRTIASNNQNSQPQNESKFKSSESLIEHLPRLSLKSLLKLFDNLYHKLSIHLTNVKVLVFLITVLILVSCKNQSSHDQNSNLDGENFVSPKNNSNLLGNSVLDAKISLNENDALTTTTTQFLTLSDRAKALTKLYNALTDINLYIEDELTKLIEKWSLSFNPIFLINLYPTSNSNIHTNQNEDNGNSLPESHNNSLNPDENNKLINAFQTLHQLHASSKTFFQNHQSEFGQFSTINHAYDAHVTKSKSLNVQNLAQNGSKTITQSREANILGVSTNKKILENGDLYPDDKNPFSSSEDVTSLNENDNDNLEIGESNTSQIQHSIEPNYQILIENGGQNINLEKNLTILGHVTENCHNGSSKTSVQTDYLSKINSNNASHNNSNNISETNLESKNSKHFEPEDENLTFFNVLRKISSQTINFYVQRTKKDLQHSLSREKWKPCDVSTSLAQIFETYLNQASPVNDGFTNLLQLPDFIIQRSKEKEAVVPSLSLNQQSYLFCGSAQLLLRLVLLYSCLLNCFPFATKFLYSAIIHLFKIYNSSTYQLLLGAGAINSAGLKSITIKHLSLSLADLQFFEELCGVLIHQSTSAFTPLPTNLAKHMSATQKDYTVHVDDTINKIAEIMEHNLSKYISEWEVKAPTPSPIFMSISKQIELFFTNVRPIIPFATLQIIMAKIDEAFRRLLKYKVTSLGIVNDGGPRAGVLISELMYYNDTIRRLGVVSNTKTESNNSDIYNSLWDFLK